jgi:hypothetical protein
MARMSREFSLVLLGAGLLTAGYFLRPQEEPLEKADKANGGPAGGNRRYARVHIIPIITSSRASPTVARTATIRGGFGRTGIRFGGGLG